jgi:hypothetical protein
VTDFKITRRLAEVPSERGMTAHAVDPETAVARSLAGQDIGRPLTRSEKSAVARELHGKRFTDRAIALHLGVHDGDVPRLITGRPPRKGGDPA